MTSQKTLARIAGLLYLMVALGTGLASVVRANVVVAGDAAATVENVRASEGLFRLGVAGDLVSTTCFLLTAMALYLLLREINRPAAAAMVTFVAVSVAMQSLNLVNEIAVLNLASGTDYGSGLGVAQSSSLALLFIDMQRAGFLLSEMFFGLWLLPLGYLVVKSGLFPRILGFLLGAAGIAYVIDLFVQLLAPGAEWVVLPAVGVLGSVAELGFMAWLVVKAVPGPFASGRARIPASA